MKKTPIAIALTAIISIGLSAPLWAESGSIEKGALPTESGYGMETNRQAGEESTMPSAMPGTMPHQAMPAATVTAINAESYLDKDVVTTKGETIGKVDKLVTKNDGNEVYAIVGVGGFFGIGEKDAAIPINQLELQGDQWVLSSGVTEESLKNGMMYEESDFSAFETMELAPAEVMEDSSGNKPSDNVPMEKEPTDKQE